MANAVELRNRVKSILNANVEDPYWSGGTRSGNQFFDESDDFNFNRANTFPKGYIMIGDSPSIEPSGFGKTGIAKKWTTLMIYYYAKEGQKYTTGSDIYTDKDIVSFTLENIKDALLENRVNGYHLNIDSFGDGGEPKQITAPNGKFKLWWGVLPVTYIWSKTYG